MLEKEHDSLGANTFTAVIYKKEKYGKRDVIVHL